MARFTTRVELHDAVSIADYEKLHTEMGKENFTRTLVTDNGEVKMPTAEYNKDGNYTKEQVLESAKRAASKTGKTFSILVTESNGRVWFNLDTVKK